jgi:hypothetical protein
MEGFPKALRTQICGKHVQKYSFSNLWRNGVKEVAQSRVFLRKDEGGFGLEGHVVSVYDVGVRGQEIRQLELALKVSKLRGCLGQQLQGDLCPCVSAFG